MGLKPVGNLYVIKNGYVISSSPVNEPITVDGTFVIAFNASEFTSHAKLTKPTLRFTTSRTPVSDSWDVSVGNRVVLEPLVVGQKYSFDGTYYASCSYYGKSAWYPDKTGTYAYGSQAIRPSADGLVYFSVYGNAFNVNGNIGTRTEDQTFTFSNFDLTYTISNDYPLGITSNFTGGYKNPTKENAFELSPVYLSDVITQYKLASGTLHYKKTTASSYQSISSASTTITVPANTFEAGTQYDVYFSASSTDGRSASTEAVTLSTTDGPAVVSPISPNNEVTHGDITYSWNYSNVTGELQYAYDIQTSPNGSEWTTILSHVVSSQTSATYTQSSAGVTYWRVRGYNQNDVAGEWSSAVSYINNVPPQPPIILEVIPGGRPQVRWSAENQISYRIQVVQSANSQIVYDSGDIYGTESLALINTYLPNGNYTIKVKVSNIYGGESQWSSAEFRQTTELPALSYSASYSEGSGGVVVTVGSDGFEKYYLVRNGTLIAKFTETTYIDHFASGNTNYRLIAVDSDDLFAQAVFSVNAVISSARLITEDGTVLNVSERWDSMNNVEQSEEIRFSANEYLGASYPEHLFSKMHVKRFTRAFSDPNRIARQLLGTVAFYADEYGNGDWVAITSYTRADSWLGDDTKIEMEVTARKEDVTYAV